MARRLGRKNPEVIDVHIGNLLLEKLKEFHLTKVEVARRTNRAQTSILPLTRRPSMQAYILWEISIAMKYDFFSSLSKSLLEKHPDIKSETTSLHATIASLEKELAATKVERDYMKKALDVLAKMPDSNQ
jgi:hypothetical protein